MELRVLKYFLALAREGSISGAAAALHISQPTLSRQLMDLERELGCTLFTRGRNGVTLTADGMLLRRRAAEMVRLADIARAELVAGRGELEGEVRIGCAETRAFDMVVRVMEDFRREHPRVRFFVTSNLAEDAVEKVDHGLLDLCLLLRLRESWGLEAVRLPTSERAMVVLPSGHPLAARESVAMDDLVGEPLIVPASWRESGILAGEMPREEGGRLEVAALYDLPFVASRMVRSGLGCALCLDGLLDDALAPGLVLRPVDATLDMPAYLAWKPARVRTAACEAFLARVRETLGSAGEGRAGEGHEGC